MLQLGRRERQSGEHKVREGHPGGVRMTTGGLPAGQQTEQHLPTFLNLSYTAFYARVVPYGSSLLSCVQIRLVQEGL